ncbi:MAG: hypothetical protein ABSG85_16605, partial [Spirochaetia bacterium]
MIRRHLTPALVAFIALLLGCLGSPLLGGRWWLTAILSLVLAAAGVVLAASEPARPARTWRRAGILLLSASAGLLLGAGSQVRIANTRARSSLAMPESEVTDF